MAAMAWACCCWTECIMLLLYGTLEFCWCWATAAATACAGDRTVGDEEAGVEALLGQNWLRTTMLLFEVFALLDCLFDGAFVLVLFITIDI
jgi:hypothetical protein